MGSDAIHSVLDAVLLHARSESPARLHFAEGEPALSYGELWAQVEQTRERLLAHGLAPGDRVALSMANARETVVALLAAFHAGATVLPLYHRPGMRATSRTQGKDYARIVAVLRASGARHVLTRAGEVACHEQAATEAGHGAQVFATEALATGTNSGPAPAAEPHERRAAQLGSPALIQFSAGSTAEPKGLCLDHAQLVSNVHGLAHGLGWTAEDRVYSWLPLFHDMGLVAVVLTSLYVGSSLTLRTPRQFIADPLGWLLQMSRERSTLSMAPQFAYALALGKAQLDPAACEAVDLSSLRLLLNGAEQVDPLGCERFEAFFARFGLRPHTIQPGYGLAENCVAVTVRPCGSPRLIVHFDRAALALGHGRAHAEPTPDSVARAGNGKPVLGTGYTILDGSDRELPEGEIGEIAIRGEATARAALLGDGRVEPLPSTLRTGDLGLVLQGELFVVGRVKEMVKRGGEAFSPTDIEQCIGSQLPELGLVAAFGFFDEHSRGEEIVVVAEARAYREPEQARELAAKVRACALREFRVPLYDVVIARPASVPKTTSGKLRRLALRDSYMRGELR